MYRKQNANVNVNTINGMVARTAMPPIDKNVITLCRVRGAFRVAIKAGTHSVRERGGGWDVMG